MVADIFYPIFTLKITVLACFIQEKQKNLGASSPPGHLPGPPGGVTAPPIPQAEKKKKKNYAPIFFLDYTFIPASKISKLRKRKSDRMNQSSNFLRYCISIREEAGASVQFSEVRQIQHFKTWFLNKVGIIHFHINSTLVT